MGTLTKNKNGFVKSPFRYPGGKFYALKFILPFITCKEHDEYREPFVGGGNVFFGKPKSNISWINDLETDIINIYKVISDNSLRNELIEMLVKEVANKKRHAQIKKMVPHGKLEKAFKIYYLNRTSYSGIINTPAWGYAEGKSSPPQNWGKLIGPAGEKLEDVKITDMDFEEVISAPSSSNSVLLYLDPPYYWADQKRAYTKPFAQNDHHRLASTLKESKYNFCLSYDDCVEVRSLYSWALIYERAWLYNTANIKDNARKLGNELIITNYEVQLDAEQVNLFN